VGGREEGGGTPSHRNFLRLARSESGMEQYHGEDHRAGEKFRGVDCVTVPLITRQTTRPESMICKLPTRMWQIGFLGFD